MLVVIAIIGATTLIILPAISGLTEPRREDLSKALCADACLGRLSRSGHG